MVDFTMVIIGDSDIRKQSKYDFSIIFHIELFISEHIFLHPVLVVIVIIFFR